MAYSYIGFRALGHQLGLNFTDIYKDEYQQVNVIGDFRHQTITTQGLIIREADNCLASQARGAAAVRSWARASQSKGEF